MKKLTYGSQILLIGEADETKSIYRSISKNKNTDIIPMILNFPKFNPSRLYGLLIDEDMYLHVLSPSVTLRLVLEGDFR